METILVSMETASPANQQNHATQTTAPNLERHLGYALRQISNHVSGTFARALQVRHTSVAEWVVLCQVREHPRITPGEIAEALNLTRGAVSKIIDKLEAKKWIASSTKPADGRVQLLSLTRPGTRTFPKLVAIADQNDHMFFGGLNAGERESLRRLLYKLAEFHQIKAVPIK